MAGSVGEAYVFFVLQILGGHVGIPIILLTYSITGIRRHPLVENFLVTWVIYTTSLCLLLYTGNQFTFSTLQAICNIQASLIYGCTIMVALSALAFIFNLWSCTRMVTQLKVGDENLTTEKQAGRGSHLRILLFAPYIAFLTCTTIMLCLSWSNKNFIGRDPGFFYCTVQSNYSHHVVPITSGCIMAAALVLLANVAIRLYRMYKVSGSLKINEDCSLSIVMRTAVTFVCMFCTLIACIVVPREPELMGPYIFQGALPTIVFFIFGTQAELLRAWGLVGLYNRVRRLVRSWSGRTNLKSSKEQDIC